MIVWSMSGPRQRSSSTTLLMEKSELSINIFGLDRSWQCVSKLLLPEQSIDVCPVWEPVPLNVGEGPQHVNPQS